MTKEDRFRIIAKASGKVSPSPIDITYDIDFFVLDELKYAGLKAWSQQLDVNEEFNKVLEAYNFDGYSPSQNVLNYIRHYSLYPELAAMQHCDLNDNVSYIGEYYDKVLGSLENINKKDQYKSLIGKYEKFLEVGSFLKKDPVKVSSKEYKNI